MEITNYREEDNTLKFTLSGVDVSIANAIRRVIISDIKTLVFITVPYNNSLITIHKNTTRLNNEILKQRLSCIPIHITDPNFPIDDHIVEINKKNETDTIQFVTTGDFKIKNIKSDKYLSDTVVKKIFPRNPISKDFILFARLKPEISKDLKGEELKITAKMSWSNASENGSFNVASTCSYKMTPDPILQDQNWKKVEKNFNAENIENEKKNWYLLEGKRFYKKNSFDFIIETVGVFSNSNIVYKACQIIIDKLKNLDISKITESASTIENSYDITLNNEDYTIGKILEYMLYSEFFENTKELQYIGFKKFHPHDSHCIIRIALKEPDEDRIQGYITASIQQLQEIYQNIQKNFEHSDVDS